MKSISVLYEGRKTVIDLIEKGELCASISYFIQIVTASAGPDEALEIAKFVKNSFPNATIMGFSASGLIYKGMQHLEGTLIIFQTLEKTQVFQACFTWEGKSATEVATEVANAIAGKSARLMHVVTGDRYYDVHQFVEEFNKCNNTTAMVGGIAGGVGVDNAPGFVFSSDGVVNKGIIIAALCGDEFSFYNGVNTAHEPISNKHRVTKAENGVWKEINNKGARQWLFEQLGVEQAESYSDWEVMCANDMLVHFPMILEGFEGTTRFLRYDAENDGLGMYYNKMPEGTEFRVGYVNPTECLQESFRLCNEVMSQPIEGLFCYTCLFRRLYLQNCSDWELSPYKNVDLSGAFMMGEIFSVNGHNELLNGSCCLVGVAENENYIRPNMQVFEELKAIVEDTTNLLNVVLKRQQESTTRQNERLMEILLEQQEIQRNQMYIDFNTGMANYLKYKEDIKTKNFDKLCIMKIENADLIITHLGHGAYQQIIRKLLRLMKSFIGELCDEEHALLERYVFNESTFFVVADERMSESHFMNICKKAHEDYRIFHTEQEEVVVSRFVVCLNQKDAIESALNALVASKNTQNSFLVCENDNYGTSSEEEFKMIGVLNRAFEKNGIIPYFQGIYSNKEKRISYYEALVRIKDVDGTVYAPGQFIDIAKKYHMYSVLSGKMLNKVFDLFCDLDEVVSMNISAFDIQSDATKQMIYQCLRSCANPKNFVFEILEDEAYQDFEPLKEFIKNVQELGARVAIDDFGAGYSNLHEISSINFDIIKVDGGIIRNLPSSESNRKLLDVITHMGVLFKADIVAEFVENQTIQDIIEQTGIDFSQGYLFAKPMPFEELGLVKKEENKTCFS